MAKLPLKIVTLINDLKQQTLDVLHEAKATELKLFNAWGETEETALFFEELVGVAEEARTIFSRLNELQLRVAEAQPKAMTNLLEVLDQVIEFATSKIPAWERSIEEVRLEFDL